MEINIFGYAISDILNKLTFKTSFGKIVTKIDLNQ